VWAVATSTGTLARGSHVTGVTRAGTGDYQVQADRDISSCAYVGNVGDAGTASGGGGAVRTAGTAGSPDTVTVTTFDGAPNGLQQADEPFHLIVICP
jgi:hypothetical protein